MKPLASFFSDAKIHVLLINPHPVSILYYDFGTSLNKIEKQSI